MAKKLSLLLAAVAVLAFAVPAFASAATGLTEAGALVPTGKIITGTNIGNVTTTSPKIGNIICEQVMVEAELEVNNAAKVEAGEGGTSSAKECKRAGAAEEVVDVEVIDFETTGGGTGVLTVAYKVKLTGGTVCEFTGINDTFTYNPAETAEGGHIIVVSKGALNVKPAACGTTATLDGSFTLTTQNLATQVYLM